MSNQTLEATVDPELVNKWIEEIGSGVPAAVPLLQAIQGEYGYLPRDAMDLIIANSDINASQLFGVATFYAQFRMRPVGRHLVKVCHGTACHVRGADRLNTSLNHILNITDEEEDTASNGSYTVEDVACVGCCSIAPALVIDDDIIGNLSGADAQRVLKKHAKGCKEDLPGDTSKKKKAAQENSNEEARS
ncbi:MAG: NAD(P)H-dependent oxidoreductase subunit E [Gammaproteobacteria bacterium]|nr:NAD(P)H-dependent oxidoreductase subunit E [Gammaproteobacteria bacterium]